MQRLIRQQGLGRQCRLPIRLRNRAIVAAYSSGVSAPAGPRTAGASNDKTTSNRARLEEQPFQSVLQVILENQRKFRHGQEQSHSSSEQVDQATTAAPPLPTTTSTPPPSNGGDSLFDVFPVPKKIPRRPNAFPEQSFAAYEALMQDILQRPEFRKMHLKKQVREEEARPIVDWLLSDVPVVDIDLPIFNDVLQGGKQLPLSSGRKEIALADVEAQKTRFMKAMHFTRAQHAILSGGMFKMANLMAKHGDGQPMSVLWEKIKEAGISGKEMLHNVLYVAATFPTGSCSKAKRFSKYGHLAGLVSILDVLDSPGSDGQADNSGGAEDDAVDLVDEIAIYHDLIHVPTEQSVNIRIRLLVSQGKAEEADALLREQSTVTEGLHLRVFRPVLRLHLELGDSAAALRLFGKMMEVPSVIIDAEAYMHLLNGLAKNGNLRPNSGPLQGIADAGFSATGGPKLFDEVAGLMSGTILDVPDNLAKLFRTSLAEGFPEFLNDDSSPLAPLPLAVTRNCDAPLFADRVKIPSETGICPLSGVKLHLAQITENERRNLMDRLLTLSTTAHNNYAKERRITRSQDSANDNLKRFYTWLDERKGSPFTTIVDGANVGYYQQNFENGRFSYHQIVFVVDALQRLGENPLVILPLKYSRHSFLVSNYTAGGSQQGSKQILTKEELSIQKSLMERDCLYFVQSTFLDDLYWILASISNQTTSRQGRDLTVAPNDPSGRWPGVRPILITNDQMRDHQMEMLGPLLFRRWYSNCIVNYNLFPFINGRQSNNSIGFCPADFFSREIQRNTDETGATVWHFPLKDKENEWFCVKLPGS